MILLPQEYWEVRNTEKKGRGIFAVKAIEAGTVIGDYVGMIVDASTTHDKDGLYAMELSEDKAVVGDRNKIGAHTINHCCTPNCEVIPYKGHMIFFALRHIFPGEELSISYFLEPPDEECNPCRHACYCDSPLCKGTWHVPQKDIDHWYTFLEKYDKTEPEGTYTIGEQLQPLQSYPKTIEDNPMFDTFANLEADPLVKDDVVVPSSTSIKADIRNSGRKLHFKNLDLTVLGTLNGLLICE